MSTFEEVWVEKYKPADIDSVIGNDHLKTKFKGYIEKGEIPTLMFCGIAGVGKTLSAKIIAYAISGENNVLYINASKDNSIEIVRTRIEAFCCTSSMDKKMKTIILDEFDYFSMAGQAALRSTIETFYGSCRFIFTANYESKICNPILSRCQKFDFKKSDIKHVIKRCFQIVASEKVGIEDIEDKAKLKEQMKKIIIDIAKSCYPDIRKTINTLQLLTYEKNGKRYLKEYSTVMDDKQEIIEYLKNGQVSSMRELVIKEGYEIEEIYRIIFDNAKNITENLWPELYIKVNEAQKSHALVLDKAINFAAAMVDIIKLLKTEK